MKRCLLLPIALAACGGHAPPPTFARASTLPPSVVFVGGFDAVKLKATPLWSKIGSKLIAFGSRRERRELAELKRLCDFDPVRDLRWVVMAGERVGDPDDGVLIVNGAWSDDKVQRCAAAYHAKDSDRARRPSHPARSRDDLALLGQMPAEPAPAPTYSSDEEDRPDTSGFKHYGDAYFAWLAPDTAAIAFKRRALPLLRKIVENKSSTANPALQRAVTRIDPNATMWFAGVGGGDDSRLYHMDPFSTDVLKHAMDVSFSAVLGNELHAKFAAEQPSLEKVPKLVKYAQERLRDKLEGMPYLDHVKISSTGTLIEGTFDLDAPAIDLIAGMIVVQADRKIADDDNDRYDAPPTPVAPEPPPAPPSDRDGDGIIDSLDKCPDVPEDKNGYQDEDGCPDADQLKALQASQLAAKQAAERAVAEKQAKSHSEQGRAYLDAGVFDKALEEFRTAYQLVPLPKLQFNIAVAYDKMRSKQEAIDAYKKYVEMEPDDPLAKEARKRIAELTRDLKKK
jgi:tetratricopeptide (TPR) repeat protein